MGRSVWRLLDPWIGYSNRRVLVAWIAISLLLLLLILLPSVSRDKPVRHHHHHYIRSPTAAGAAALKEADVTAAVKAGFKRAKELAQID